MHVQGLEDGLVACNANDCPPTPSAGMQSLQDPDKVHLLAHK